MRRLALLTTLCAVSFGESILGIWTMDAQRSTFAGEIPPRSLTVRIEPHAKGEVFTLDRIEADGRRTSSSTVLYFDGQSRAFEDFGCSGTQSSRWLDGITAEILRNCERGRRIRMTRRPEAGNFQLILEVTEQNPDGHRFERKFVFEKSRSWNAR